MSYVYYAHSGLRYLVLLVGVAAVGYSLFGILRRRSSGRPARVLGAAFVGLLDLQVVVGLLLLWMIPYYPRLMGHIVLMLAAAVVGHGGSMVSRRRGGSHWARLVAFTVSLLLIVGGIMAIGRSVFQSMPVG